MGRPKGSKNRQKPEAAPPVPAPAQPSVSVVIPHVTDPWLYGTCRDILATAPGVDIVVVQDGQQPDPEVPDGVRVVMPWAERHGVGPSRDVGIATATGEVIVCMDAHSRPKPGWLAGMLDVLARNPEAIACAQCGICHQQAPGVWSDPSRIETGARLLYQTPNGYPLEPDWVRGLAPGTELSLALGGTYAFRRARYDAIGVPWRSSIGWGTSEQTLCLVNWFLGGATILADAVVDHILWGRRPDGRPEPKPYPPDPALAPGAFYNRLRLIDLLPMPAEEKARLSAAVMFHATRWGSDAARMLANRRRDEARDAMGLAVRAWDDWCAFAWPAGRQYRQPTMPPPVVNEHRPEPVSVLIHGRRRVIGGGQSNVRHGSVPLMQSDPRQWI